MRGGQRTPDAFVETLKLRLSEAGMGFATAHGSITSHLRALAMSMEIHVLSDQRLLSVGAWQQALDAEGFSLNLSPEMQFDALRGFLPARLRSKASGFECYHDNARELMDAYAETITFARAWKYALSFRWGSSLHEEI